MSMSADEPRATLSALRLHLLRCALGSLLALNPLGSPPRCCSRALRLLSLLLTLKRCLLFLAFLDGGLPGEGAGFGTHRPTFSDDLEGSTNDGALVLDCAAGTLLGYFLLAE